MTYLKRRLTYIFILINLFTFAVTMNNSFAASSLNNIKRDIYMQSLEKNINKKKYTTALRDIRRLKKLNVRLPANFYFYRGKVYYHTGKKSKSIKDFKKYVRETGKRGRYYKIAMRYIRKSRKKSGQVNRRVQALYNKYLLNNKMIYIPGGSFKMGDAAYKQSQKQAKPAHAVKIKPFKISRYEVTIAQYKLFRPVDISQFIDSEHDDFYDDEDDTEDITNIDTKQFDQWPIVNISWNDANEYVRWLTDVTKFHFRLPSEAEWEYAARARTTTDYYWGNTVIPGYCNGCGRSGGKLSDVGIFKPNNFGLFDMAGNAYEMVKDCYNKTYKGAPSDGSAWNSGRYCGHLIVLRGGSFKSGRKKATLKSSYRTYIKLKKRRADIGFRIVQEIK